ncbi:MAG TPA: hypothetical protein VLM85_16375, partial [Polyangiaceae bacterium]|nr:hypothetical protein [Polyangiaceae bacterium]
MRVGARLRFAWVLAFVSPVVRCGTQSTYPVDADADADASPKQCSGFLASECPAGERCLFRVDEGCAAKGVCLAVTPGICQQSWCTCRWDAPAPMCGPPGYVTTPVVSLDGDVCPSEYACGLACELCDVSGYSSTTMSAPTATPNACTPAQITGAST